ncbi:MAG: UDP-N-acetylglucosamine 2-epimerase (non-hydrolyzing) [Gracilimonas sp.]|uniref:non-hydrolyzing UDP-N-acetylglucosamine 2-epimerase n=1 Tax=Gracilimonas TaxID=649462 RepID=UPI001B0A1515|nr:UDP-N-acetylglucosamine 2-epimerase (non-hydrolyzing) [Gracilimonas sp.]MBO6585150.1 UDP-N-acetylglucosamine 2-epimerase (non-hydrolyzing) [Gracilimonas sp.]MBO6615578.1 UDP-N-acetylglucosamine 2-epimerase (non-hydrolyzing) [Gracilimonas sp.]
MKKIISIVGARPQFIKLSALTKELNKKYNEVIVHTGQHYDNNMSEVFFEELGIQVPKYNLNIGSGLHGEQTGKMMGAIEEVIHKEEPDLVITFGDTNSTLAGAIVAAKLGVVTIHIEAGLRSFNKAMPEEINRVLTDHASDYLFAPTQEAVSHLEREGLGEKTVLTGDIMVDTVLNNVKIAAETSNIIEKYNLHSSGYYLATLHRPYNVDDPQILSLTLEQLNLLDKKVLFPMHPRTQKSISDSIISVGDNIEIIEPAGYLDFLQLMSNSYKIITDSGGIQKEAYILEKPCITLRSETEWTETVDAGWNLLINIAETSDFHRQIIGFSPKEYHPDLYGINVGSRMAREIENILS